MRLIFAALIAFMLAAPTAVADAAPHKTGTQPRGVKQIRMPASPGARATRTPRSAKSLNVTDFDKFSAGRHQRVTAIARNTVGTPAAPFPYLNLKEKIGETIEQV